MQQCDKLGTFPFNDTDLTYKLTLIASTFFQSGDTISLILSDSFFSTQDGLVKEWKSELNNPSFFATLRKKLSLIAFILKLCKSLFEIFASLLNEKSYR